MTNIDAITREKKKSELRMTQNWISWQTYMGKLDILQWLKHDMNGCSQQVLFFAKLLMRE